MENERLYRKFKDLSQEDLNATFVRACKLENLEVVQYLLSSPDLNEHADIHAFNDSAFVESCFFGYLTIAKYLLTSSDLKEHANIHGDNDGGFISACKENELEILKFLIFDMNIEKTEQIKECLNENKNNEVENMFNLRELNENLNNDLSNNKLARKKNKI